MLGGLYEDLPPPSFIDEDRITNPSSNVWSNSVKMAPAGLHKPSLVFSPSTAVLKSQIKSKIGNSPSQSKIMTLMVVTESAVDEGRRSPTFQPALVDVTLTVMDECDPTRPNDYEEYRRERKRKAGEAEMKRELDRRRQEEEGKKRRERENAEKERERELNISGQEAWKRQADMSGGGGGVAAPLRSPSPPSSADKLVLRNRKQVD